MYLLYNTKYAIASFYVDERENEFECVFKRDDRERERERERRDFSAHNVLNEKSEKAIFVRLFYKKSFGKIVETHFHDLLLKQLR